jgi:hypothetical protein
MQKRIADEQEELVQEHLDVPLSPSLPGRWPR